MQAHAFNIVLVHGGFVDGSGWERLYIALRRYGYDTSVVQNPTLSLEGDVAAVNLVMDQQDRPTILVGHSYGGAVITQAGNHRNVAGLVYISAFAPDVGESVEMLIRSSPPESPVPPILPPQNGFLFLDAGRFRASFADDIDPDKATFMAHAQVPWGVDALTGKVTQAAWRTKPSWYIVATEDRMIPPPAQRAMAKRAGAYVTEVRGSHSIFISRADAIADVIAAAAASKALAA